MEWNLSLFFIPVFYLPAFASWVKYNAAIRKQAVLSTTPFQHFESSINPWRGAMWACIFMMVFSALALVFIVGVEPLTYAEDEWAKPVLFTAWFLSYPVNLIMFRYLRTKLAQGTPDQEEGGLLALPVVIAWDIIKHACMLALFVLGIFIISSFYP